MFKDKWIITDKTFRQDGTISYDMQTVDIHSIAAKTLVTTTNNVFVGSYTDADLNPLPQIQTSGKYSYDIGTIKFAKYANYNTKNELFYFFKFFNATIGDFYAAIPTEEKFNGAIFNAGDRVSLALRKTRDDIPYFIAGKNLTTGKELDFGIYDDKPASGFQEFVVLGKGETEQDNEKTNITNDVIIQSKQFGLFHARFSFLHALPLFISKPGDKILLCGNRATREVDILRNITIDNLRTEFLLSQDIR